MFNWIFWLMLAFAVTDWIGSWRGWGRVRWLTKPGTLVLLIAWFTQAGGWRGPLFWFGLGLCFSLLGDVLLHVPSNLFLPGMAAFFLAHICYIVGFAQSPLTVDWRILVIIISMAAIYIQFSRKIRAGLRANGATSMLPPLLVYAFIISVMVFFAISTLFRPGWGALPAVLAAIGAILFYASDSILAYSRFVRPLTASDLRVMVTYHLAQILIAIGVVVQFA
jgi:uncharacterized membrane protein YhhN